MMNNPVGGHAMKIYLLLMVLSIQSIANANFNSDRLEQMTEIAKLEERIEEENETLESIDREMTKNLMETSFIHVRLEDDQASFIDKASFYLTDDHYGKKLAMDASLGLILGAIVTKLDINSVLLKDKILGTLLGGLYFTVIIQASSLGEGLVYATLLRSKEEIASKIRALYPNQLPSRLEELNEELEELSKLKLELEETIKKSELELQTLRG